jgi:hypothetical protein
VGPGPDHDFFEGLILAELAERRISGETIPECVGPAGGQELGGYLDGHSLGLGDRARRCRNLGEPIGREQDGNKHEKRSDANGRTPRHGKSPEIYLDL